MGEEPVMAFFSRECLEILEEVVTGHSTRLQYGLSWLQGFAVAWRCRSADVAASVHRPQASTTGLNWCTQASMCNQCKKKENNVQKLLGTDRRLYSTVVIYSRLRFDLMSRMINRPCASSRLEPAPEQSLAMQRRRDAPASPSPYCRTDI